jgi:uncharacterized membrane protein YhaH (DUF805 family)
MTKGGEMDKVTTAGSSMIVAGLIASLIPAPLVAYGVMRILDEDWSVFWITLAAIYAFYFLMWVIRSMINFLLFHLIEKRTIANVVYENLANSNFPNPDDHWFEGESPETYYESIWEDNSNDCELRLKAFALHATVDSARKTSVQSLLMTAKAHKIALKKYKKSHF